MQIEIGSIVEGEVTGVKNFGAFVLLPENSTGMVHISEVSQGYVTNLEEMLTVGQKVKVKVLSVSPEGKIALSIKQAQPAEQGAQQRPQQRKPRKDPPPKVWQPKAPQPQGEMGFEDMMSNFKQQSEEKMADVRRSTEARRGSGGYSRRGHKG